MYIRLVPHVAHLVTLARTARTEGEHMVAAHVVESALDVLRPGLAADGFDLRAGTQRGAGVVEVVLEAKPDACLDCLVPDDLLVQILDEAIRSQDSSLGRVDLVKQGFDAVEAH